MDYVVDAILGMMVRIIFRAAGKGLIKKIVFSHRHIFLFISFFWTSRYLNISYNLI